MSRSEKPRKQNCYEVQKNQNQSFSSSLLDEIYRSIDTVCNENPNDLKFYADEDFRKKIVDEAVFPRKCRPNRNRLNIENENRVFGSTSSSSDSSSSVFSSSDTEFMNCKKISKASCFGTARPKPRKTEERPNRAFQLSDDYNSGFATDFAKRHERNLKKTKTPVSPGGRLASFINSLFINTKKSAARNYSHGFVHKTRGNDELQQKITRLIDSSSVSSFSRSCLSKNSQKQFEAGTKRSVRFRPDNVVFDPNNCTALKLKLKLPKNAEEDEVMGEFLRNYENRRRNLEDEEDDDAESESSSDLFELDVVGYHRYREELPVYETTCAGLIM